MMQLDDIALQRLRDDAGALASHLLFPQLRRKTGRLGQMVTRNISSYLQQIIDLDAGRHLWKYRLHNIVDRRPICFFHLLKREGNNLSLSFGTGIVRIHQTETPICNRLHTVQMVHAR